MSMFAGDLSSKYLRQGYGMPTSSLRNQPTQAGMGVSSVIKQPLRNTGGRGLPNLRETSAYKQGLTGNIDQNMGGYVDPSLYSDPNLGQPESPRGQLFTSNSPVLTIETADFLRPSGGISPVTGGGFPIGGGGQPNPYQTNVDWMNQMAQQNAQVGSDGSSVFPTFSYDPKTNQYMRDSSAFGLTGDAANTYYSPEDFQSEFGRTLGKMPSTGGGDQGPIGTGVPASDVPAFDPSYNSGITGGMQLGQTGQDVPPTGIANDPVLTGGNTGTGGTSPYAPLDIPSGTSPSDSNSGYWGSALGGLLSGDWLGALRGAGDYYSSQQDIEGAYRSGLAGMEMAQQLGQQVAEGSQFKPYTVTSNLAQVQTDPRGGYNVNLSPQQQALQNQALGQAGQFFGQAGSYDPSIAAQRGAMGGLFGQSLGQYGQPTGLEGLTQAGISGAQGQLSRAGQPFDINQLRGQFAGQVGSYLGQQPDAGIGALGQQALRLGSQGLGQYGQGQEGFGSLQGLLTSQAGSRLQDSASTLPSQVASQVYGLGMQGLQDRSAPTDIEALRSQYAGLAGQAGQGLLSTPEQRQADIYESIRATQTPEEQRQRLALEERMLAQGRTGVSSDAYGGASPELLAMETARQEAMARAGLSARQQAMAEQQQGLATAQSLTGLTTGLAGTSSDLQSAAQSRASQLTQLGLSADQIQSQLESEGLSRGLQTTQAAGQMAGIRSDLDSASQARATQLSQLGLSAEQIESQLQSEGLSRATTAGTTAGQLAGIASDLETAGIGRGTALANLGLAGTQASNTMGRQQLEDLMNLQRSDMSSAQIQQALQQGNLGLGTGMLQAGYMPQQQALEMLRQSQVPAQFASAGRLQGADLQAQLGGRGIESLMQGSQLANELRQQQLAASLQSVLGAQNPTTGSFGGGLLEKLFGGSGGEYDWLPDWIGNPVYSDLEDETDEYDDYYDYDGGE